MSIPLYLYDIFETKMKMPNPKNYIKNKEYREAVNENNTEKINKLLKKEASAKGYEAQKYFGDGSWAAPTAVVEKEDFTKIIIENGKYKVILWKDLKGEYVISDYDNSRKLRKKERNTEDQKSCVKKSLKRTDYLL